MNERSLTTARTAPDWDRTGQRAVLDAAIATFAALGYHGTSVREIAGRLRVSPAALYNHFPSKNAILVALLERIMTELISETRRSIADAGPDHSAQLAAAVGAYVTFHIYRQEECFVGNSEIRSLSPEQRQWYVTLRDSQESLFRTIILGGVEAGEFKTEYPIEAGRSIITMCRAVAEWYRPDGRHTPAKLGSMYGDFALKMVGAR